MCFSSFSSVGQGCIQGLTEFSRMVLHHKGPSCGPSLGCIQQRLDWNVQVGFLRGMELVLNSAFLLFPAPPLPFSSSSSFPSPPLLLSLLLLFSFFFPLFASSSFFLLLSLFSFFSPHLLLLSLPFFPSSRPSSFLLPLSSSPSPPSAWLPWTSTQCGSLRFVRVPSWYKFPRSTEIEPLDLEGLILEAGHFYRALWVKASHRSQCKVLEERQLPLVVESL